MPKVDYDRLLCCVGRWQFADNLTHYHEAGHHVILTNPTLANFSTKYWMVAAREETEDWGKACDECRCKLKATKQLMALLPDVRVRQPLRAFTHVPIDYSGPCITVQGHRKRSENCSLCLFTCQAVHLEMAYGLDTDSFLRWKMQSHRVVYRVKRGEDVQDIAAELRDEQSTLRTLEVDHENLAVTRHISIIIQENVWISCRKR